MFEPKLLSKVISVLESLGIDYMITGSLVSSFQGEPRASHDIDIVVNISKESAFQIAKAFDSPGYYISEVAINEALQYNTMFNLIGSETGDKVDFWILTNEPFDKSRFARKYKAKVFGFEMIISKPEDTILAKLKWAKLSGGSEKQLVDSINVYEVQFEKLDMTYLMEWINKLDLLDYWKLVLDNARPFE